MKSRNEFTTTEEYNEYLRIYFAGLAMQGMLSNSGTSNYLKGNIDLLVPELVSKFAIEYADELLKQLETSNKENQDDRN